MLHEAYQVWNTETDEEHCVLDTLSDAKHYAREDGLTHFEIWRGWLDATCDEFIEDVRVVSCNPYEGDDERVMLALGLPCPAESIF